MLVTTFVRTLPDVLSTHVRRLAAGVIDRVDFRAVYEFAREALRRTGLRNRCDRTRAAAAFDLVWRRHRRELLGPGETDFRYWREEIASVIKGRELTSLDA